MTASIRHGIRFLFAAGVCIGFISCGDEGSGGESASSQDTASMQDAGPETEVEEAFNRLKALIEYAREPNDTGNYVAERRYNFRRDLGLARETLNRRGCLIAHQLFWRVYSSNFRVDLSVPTSDQQILADTLTLDLTNVDSSKTSLPGVMSINAVSEGQLVLQRDADYATTDFFFTGWEETEDLNVFMFENDQIVGRNRALYEKAGNTASTHQRSGSFALGYAYPEDQAEIQEAFNRLVNACQDPELLEMPAQDDEQDNELLTSALIVANTINDVDDRDWTLSIIASLAANGGQFGFAFEVLDMINSLRDSVPVLPNIADRYVESGMLEEADQLLTRALEISEASNDSDLELYTQNLVAASRTKLYAETGEFDTALEIANSIEPLRRRISVLVHIAREYAKAGHISQAQQLLSRSLELASSESFDDHITPRAAVVYAEMGQFDLAMEMIDATPTEAPYALVDVAVAYAEAGRNEQASLLLSRAHRYVSSFGLSAVEIAIAYSELGRKEEAMRLLNETLQTAITTEHPRSRASALANAAYGYALIGEKPSEEDETLVRSITLSVAPMSPFWE